MLECLPQIPRYRETPEGGSDVAASPQIDLILEFGLELGVYQLLGPSDPTVPSQVTYHSGMQVETVVSATPLSGPT